VRYAGALDYVLGAYLGSYQWLDWRSESDSESLLRELIELAQRIADSTPALRVDPPQPRLEGPTPDAAPAVPLPTTPAAVHAVDCLVVPEVVVCFLHPERRKKLPEWRKWSNLTNVAVSTSGIAATMVESSSLEQAAERLRTGPERKILLLDGFEPDSAALKEIPALEGVLSRCDVIFNAPEWEEFVERPASSSLLTLQRAVTTDATVAESLRKMVLRTRARNLMTPRLLASEDELREYFSLRYRVWTELGYLPQAQRCSRIQWELDFTDRTSLPVGFFSRSNGTLLALARLVRGFGEENAALVRTIDKMIEETGSDVLRRRFLYPAAGQQHPFDILGELKEFQPYYRTLVTSGVTKAELSRVIVHPDWQKHKFGEVIVDTLCALARIQRIRVLFLACRTEHERFYARCGFRALPNITGTHFLSYNVPCLAMERRFWSGDDPSRTEVSKKATYA
jgi:GNAT superfamily N-acetyltransferase